MALEAREEDLPFVVDPRDSPSFVVVRRRSSRSFVVDPHDSLSLLLIGAKAS